VAVCSMQARRWPDGLLVSRRFVRDKPGGGPAACLYRGGSFDASPAVTTRSTDRSYRSVLWRRLARRIVRWIVRRITRRIARLTARRGRVDNSLS